jgi:hypothetical protein
MLVVYLSKAAGEKCEHPRSAAAFTSLSFVNNTASFPFLPASQILVFFMWRG